MHIGTVCNTRRFVLHRAMKALRAEIHHITVKTAVACAAKLKWRCQDTHCLLAIVRRESIGAANKWSLPKATI